ncbi:carboxymuconolactone decarboxylase family protein [Amycolatopsis magusensis]|uniref:carboxymuconolactone decarboxylase family protein n=1 Tax=Amycolatopsis magusensis TaxID=882444 RepID=UPI0024A7E495|nr:carboxymuconolactone decarboxylase family protein [Amycolatopsis magusensis]MDI5975609.1 carboxymuconolactone decarboxylase family protein [Amycolatopsis magusensis]
MTSTVSRRCKGAFGLVPNMFRAVAHSPAALTSMWAQFGALGGGALGGEIGEQIAVAVADRNRCDYCLSAHTLLGKKAGAQSGRSDDPRTDAVLKLATLNVFTNYLNVALDVPVDFE